MGKYCECSSNSRLIMVIEEGKKQISCECLSGYYLEAAGAKCKPKCAEIRFTNGTSETGECICDDGFYFLVYENSTVAFNENQ